MDILYDIYMSDIDEKRSTKNTIVCSFLVLVPVESLFVKLDDNLRYLDVGLLCWHQICLVGAPPLDEEIKLSRVVGGSNDFLSCKPSGESLWPGVHFLRRFRWFFLRLPLHGAAACVLLLLGVVPLVLLHELLALEVGDRLPGVVLGVLPALPLDQVLDLALSHPLADDLFDLIFLVRHNGGLNLISCRSESSNIC